ncbi:uncharacterized protein ACNLHF_026078 [Anomaloglossus baeobatrachus]
MTRTRADKKRGTQATLMDAGASGGGRASDAIARLSKFARDQPEIPGAVKQCDLSVQELQIPGQELMEEEEQQGAVSMLAAASNVEKGDNLRAADENTDPGRAEPTLSDVLAAVNTCNNMLATLNIQMGGIKMDISSIRHELQGVNVRVGALEDRVSATEDKLPPLTRDLGRAIHNISLLRAKVDDLENRSRRSNLRLVGVPEKAEGNNPVAFFEMWLPKTLGMDLFSPFFTIERAHRVPTRPPPPGAPPRPILLKLLHFRDRDTALRRAREIKDLAIDGHKVSLYPDFSTEIQQRRAQFIDVKKRLRQLQISYSMLYPTRLRVVADGGTKFFDTPKDAAAWLDTNEKGLRRNHR